MKKTVWSSIRVPKSLAQEIKKLSEKWDYTMWKVVELCVFSKAQRFGKGEKPRTGFVPAVQSIDITGTETPIKPVQKLSMEEKAKRGYDRRHSLAWMESHGSET